MKNILYIIWNERNNTGISIIDEQHRGIISTINSLHYFIQNGHEHDIIKPTLIMLSQYTNIHFRTEEVLMKDANYPNIEEHISHHKKLLAKTNTLIYTFNKNNSDSNSLLKFLREWWIGHINTEDMKYKPFLNLIIENKEKL